MKTIILALLLVTSGALQLARAQFAGWAHHGWFFLLTTPESLALLLSYPDAERFFANLRCVIVDELHSFATSKRGHHLALCLARLAALEDTTAAGARIAVIGGGPAGL